MAGNKYARAYIKRYGKQKRRRVRRALQRKKKVQNQIHRFRRLGYKSIIYESSLGVFGTAGSPSADPSLTLTGLIADNLTGHYQFGGSHYFSLSNVTASSDFTNLFEKYRITGVKYNIRFQSNMANVASNAVMPIIHWCFDDNDATVPSSLLDIQQKGGCRMTEATTKGVTIMLRPKVSGMVYNNGISTGYSVVPKSWINTTYPNVQHFGIKFWVNNFYTGTGQNAFTIEPTYYLALKDST